MLFLRRTLVYSPAIGMWVAIKMFFISFIIKGNHYCDVH